VPAADEVYRLQRVEDAEGKLFRKISRSGHYASYGQSFTQQGTYAITPSGVFLASINTNDAKHMADMMRKALDKWKNLSPAQRLAKGDLAAVPVKRLESKYPVDGLVLHEYQRDVLRPELEGWKATAWNQDFAWFKKEEVAQFVPPDLSSRMSVDIPAAYVKRLARLHFVDQVRGQSVPFAANQVQEAVVTSKVEMIVGTTAYLNFSGQAKCDDGSRGVVLRLYGEGEWDVVRKRFTKFDLVALGQRWGGTQNNEREDDPGPSPIGFAFTIAGDSPAEHIAPAFAYAYGW
jgi:hypothetical protein